MHGPGIELSRLACRPKVVLFLLYITAASLSYAVEGAARKHMVVIENMQFQPEVLEVRVGDLIVWKNRDLVPHTVTSSPGGKFDSGGIEPGRSWSYRVRERGNIPYVCTYHPAMTAQIVVK